MVQMQQQMLEMRSQPSLSPFSGLPKVKEPSVNPPDAYHGRKDQKLRSFTTECNLVFKLNSSRFSDEETRVAYMISYLRGPALDSLRTALEMMPPPPHLQSVKALVEFLNRNFGDPDEKATARTKLKGLKMSGTAAEYFSKFREIIAILEWTDPEPIVFTAREGLTSEIKDCIARNGQDFVDLDSLSNYVVSLDNRLRVRESERKQEGIRSASVVPSPSLPSSTKPTPFLPVYPSGLPNPPSHVSSVTLPVVEPQGPRASSFNSSSVPKGPISQEERERRYREGACIRCGQSDHRKDQCPRMAISPNYPTQPRPLPIPPTSSFTPSSPRLSPKA